MNKPMVTNTDGGDAYVTADPTLAQKGQRASPLYTAPVMDTCAHVRSSSPISGGGFVECELAVARNLAACRGDDARLDEADLSAANPDGDGNHRVVANGKNGDRVFGSPL